MRTRRNATALSDFGARRTGRVAAYLATGAWLFVSNPGVAAIATADPFARLAPVSTARLDSLRGGLRVNGFDMRFGMRVESSVSGVGEVVTDLTWDEQRGWSPTSAYTEDANGHGRHWDAADGKWKEHDPSPQARGRIARGGPGGSNDGESGGAVVTPAPGAGEAATPATASLTGDGGQPGASAGESPPPPAPQIAQAVIGETVSAGASAATPVAPQDTGATLAALDSPAITPVIPFEAVDPVDGVQTLLPAADSPAITPVIPFEAVAPVDVVQTSLPAVEPPPIAPVMPFEGVAPVDVVQTALPVSHVDPAQGSTPAGLDGLPAAGVIASVAAASQTGAGAESLSGAAGPSVPLAQTAGPAAGTPSPVADAVAHSVAANETGRGLGGSSGEGGFELVLANTGTTQILHQITSGHVAALITNQASDVTIEHRAEIDLTIANFTDVVGHSMNAIRARAIVGSGLTRF